MTWRAPRWPPNPPQPSPRPGGAVARLDLAPAHGGPEMAPQLPQRSSRPGGAVARLDLAPGHGGPRDGPPNPPALVAPRRSRGGASISRQDMGAPRWPKPPSARRAPAEPW